MALQFSREEFEQVLDRARQFYHTIGHVRCPYFQDNVAFNLEGLQHLRRKAWNRGRSCADQFMRLKHIAAAPEVLPRSSTLQGIWHGLEQVRRHRHGRWEEVFTPATFYEFVAVIKERRFKVIVKQFLGGERIFWSLIPFWRHTKEGRRILHDGNPAEQ